MYLFVVATLFLILLSTAAWSNQSDDIVAKPSAGSGDPSLVEALADEIADSPSGVAGKLVSKIKNKSLTENELAAYVWALGITKSQSVSNDLMQLYRESQSNLVKGNCLRALATIGGKQSGDFILSSLDSTSDNQTRFNFLNLLGQMQYEEVLPRMEEILRQYAKQFYWQSIFVFGKMGDKAVPFLMKRIGDKDLEMSNGIVIRLFFIS